MGNVILTKYQHVSINIIRQFLVTLHRFKGYNKKKWLKKKEAHKSMFCTSEVCMKAKDL